VSVLMGSERVDEKGMFSWKVSRLIGSEYFHGK
jgi:hypothetical protein